MTVTDAALVSLEHIRDMVLCFGADGVITYANTSAENLLAYDAGVTGHSVAEVFPEAFRMSRETIVQNKSFSPEGFEVDAYRENRTCFPVEARLLEHTPGSFIILASDVSSRVFLERQMEQAERNALESAKVKSEFVANVTHELRTPVNGILGNTLELKETETDKSRLRIFSLIERGCADMNALINNILDFSKLESGKFTLEKRAFDFREMIDYVKSNHKNKIADKGLDFIVSVAEDIPQRIVGDELRIVQVLNNLLSNACKFTSVGRISLEVVMTSRKENKIELFFLVIDTGIGIAKEKQDKLFHSFSQVDASISRRYGGTGLGLNICKQLVELMGGAIHVESDAGQGSMFSFHIWCEVPEEELQKMGEQGSSSGLQQRTGFRPEANMADLRNAANESRVYIYHSEENLEEIKRKLNKLILSAELENWEKAEGFALSIRDLTKDAPKEVKSLALRLKMAVQKEDYDKTAQNVTHLRECLKDETEGGVR